MMWDIVDLLLEFWIFQKILGIGLKITQNSSLLYCSFNSSPLCESPTLEVCLFLCSPPTAVQAADVTSVVLKGRRGSISVWIHAHCMTAVPLNGAPRGCVPPDLWPRPRLPVLIEQPQLSALRLSTPLFEHMQTKRAHQMPACRYKGLHVLHTKTYPRQRSHRGPEDSFA